MDERYFMNNRKKTLKYMESLEDGIAKKYAPKETMDSMEDIKKRMLERYPPKPPEGYYEKAIKDMNNRMTEGIISMIRPNSDLLNSVISDLEARELRGISEYGTTMDTYDLDLKAWLEHLYHELLDAALYTKKQITLLDQNDKAAND